MTITGTVNLKIYIPEWDTQFTLNVDIGDSPSTQMLENINEAIDKAITCISDVSRQKIHDTNCKLMSCSVSNAQVKPMMRGDK
jgi:hypothetical protein